MEFQVLGPLEVRRDGSVLPLGGTGQRALLAILIFRANKVVGTDRLTELLWDGEPPDTALHVLHVQVSRLRKVLEHDPSHPAILLTRSPGYELRIPAESVDASRFDTLVERGRSLLRDDPANASSTLATALALWRGEPLADLALEPFASSEVARLNELRLSATEDRMGAELALGHHAEVIGDLRRLASEHPLRERTIEQLMLALYRSGRQTEALAAYQGARARLSSELGIDPGSALQALERAVLQHDPSLDIGQGPSAAGTRPDDEIARSPVTPDVAVERPGPARWRGGRPWRSPQLIGLLAVLVAITVIVIPRISRSIGQAPQATGAASEPLLLHLDDEGTRIGQMSGIAAVHGFRPRIAVGEGAVWVSALAGLYRIDPSNPSAEVSVPVQAGALAIGFHSVWDAGDDFSLKRIDPATADPLKKIGHRIEAIVAVGGGGVWTFEDGRLKRLDPQTGRWNGSVAIDDTPADIAVSGRRIWYVDFFAGSLTAVDARTLTRIGTVPIPGSPDIVDVGLDYVWVVDRLSGIVTVVDPATMLVVKQVPVAAPATGLTVGRGAIWVTAGNELFSIDPSTFETTSFALDVRALGLAVDASDDTLWVYVGATPLPQREVESP